MEKESNILNFKEEEYGNKFREHLLEQYKIYIETADKISDRRQKNNDFFLTVNTALIAFLGYSAKQEIIDLPIVAMVALISIILCYFWYRLIRSYKDINTGKFKVVHKIEKELPISLYDIEWQELGEGKDKNKYLPFTHIEIKIPWIFILFYALIILLSIPWCVVFQNFCRLSSSCG